MTSSLRTLGATLLVPLGLAASTIRSSVSPVDCAATLDNPGCGLAGGWWTNLAPDCGTEGENLCASSRNSVQFWSLHAFSKGYAYNGDYAYFTNHIVNLVGGADIPLTANALLAVSNSLVKCRRNGGTCIPHFAYTPERWGGAEPDDFDMLLTHVRQLAGVVSQFRDVVPAVECGMVGPWGEMHTSRYTAEEYMDRVVGEWLRNLPADMPLLVRNPWTWMQYLDTTSSAFFGGGMESMDQTLRARMGFFNHGYLGTDDDYGTWNNGESGFRWDRSQARTFLRGQNVPYGGELAYVSVEKFDADCHLLDPGRHNIVAEWYDTHLSYLRNIRSSDNTVCGKLASVVFDRGKWAFDGMPNLAEYEGTDLRRFCEDHMGFRFVVRDVRFSGYPSRGCIEVKLENTGFGRLLFDDALEVLLSGEAGVFSATPREGTSSTLRSIAGGSSAALLIEFDYPKNMPPGEYDVLLRAWTPLADETVGASAAPRRPVRFANVGGWNGALKANFLCRVSLDAAVDFAPGSLWFAWNALCRRELGGRWGGDTFEGGHVSRNFEIDSGVPRGNTGEVSVEMYAEAMSENPCPEGGAAGFVFLADGNGRPVPYGYCADGWLPLSGCAAVGGQRVTLRIRVSGRGVSYAVDAAQLTDGAGRVWLPATVKPQMVGALSLVGAETDDGFFGTLGAGGSGGGTLVEFK